MFNIFRRCDAARRAGVGRRGAAAPRAGSARRGPLLGQPLRRWPRPVDWRTLLPHPDPEPGNHTGGPARRGPLPASGR